MDVSLNEINTLTRSIKGQDKYKIVQSALRSAHLKAVSVDQNAINKLPHMFNHELPETVTATNQFQSGRCWIFAGLNIFRHHLIRKYKLVPNYELSEAYIFKCDKFEKCNTVLETIYDMMKRGVSPTSLELMTINGLLIEDGGTAQQFTNIVKKYGVLPKIAFPDLSQVINTGSMNNLLQITIKKTLVTINAKMTLSEFRKYKHTILEECNRIITLCVGNVPSEFQFQGKTYTSPITFYQTIVKPLINLDDYVCIANDPRHKYDTLICPEYLNNVLLPTDKNIKRKITNLYLNVDIKDMKDAVFKTITQQKAPVWFATDYGTFVLNDMTVLDQRSSIIKNMFDTNFVFSKKTAIQTGITVGNHAMVLIGVQTQKASKGKENSKYLRWKVENSHSSDTVLNGFLTMSDAFFEQYMIAVFVHKSTLSVKQRKLVQSAASGKDVSTITWVPFYDPLGFASYQK